MADLPLGTYRLIETPDHAAACARLDEVVGGVRQVVRAPAGGGRHVVNLARAGSMRILSASIPDCTIRARDDAAGVFFLVTGGQATIRAGRSEIACRPGSIACMMPVADRTTEIGSPLSALGVRLAPDGIAAWLEDCRVAAPKGWPSVFSAAAPGMLGVYRAFELFTALAGFMELGSNAHAAAIVALGDSLVAVMASLVLSLAGTEPSGKGFTYGIAQALETEILDGFDRPFNLAAAARKLGATPAAADRALRLHRGVTAGELLALTRASSAEHALSLGATEDFAAALSGFTGPAQMKAVLAAAPAIRSRLQRSRRFV